MMHCTHDTWTHDALYPWYIALTIHCTHDALHPWYIVHHTWHIAVPYIAQCSSYMLHCLSHGTLPIIHTPVQAPALLLLISLAHFTFHNLAFGALQVWCILLHVYSIILSIGSLSIALYPFALLFTHLLFYPTALYSSALYSSASSLIGSLLICKLIFHMRLFI